MILESRTRFASSDDFKDAFIDSVTAGIIPRTDFIHWDMVFEKLKLFKKNFAFYSNISEEDKNFAEELRDALVADDAPYRLIKTAFELLGHTGKSYASMEDYIDFKVFSEQEKTEENMEYIANLLVALGLRNVIGGNLEDYFLGVQVGLETHRRKNVGGKAFISSVRVELNRIVRNLNFKGHEWSLSEEKPILYKDGKTSKKVDFLLEKEGTRIGIEVNFYTSAGSKPTEIKRSYGQVNRSLEEVNASLIWITDGCGYFSMNNSLKEAQDIHKNIYNFEMMKSSLEDDLLKI